MLDLGFVRTNLEVIEGKLRARGADPAALLGDFRVLDQNRREAITTSERLKARRNELSQRVGTMKKAGLDASAVMDETRQLKDQLDELDQTAVRLDEQMRLSLARIPNLTRDEVPVGTSEDDNQTVKTWGQKRSFDFEPKPHWEVGEALGILDLERAAKLSGARFAVYMGAGARLERALISFMLDMHTQKHGYTEVLPPFMVNSKSLFGTGQLPKFAEDLFRCSDADADAVTRGEFKDNDHWLIPTAEFQKVELVKFTRPEDSDAEHEKLTRDAEEILEALELPYRRVLLCAGDTGFSAAKTFDLEVWLPGQQLYREISSCSNFEGFQARRANIRYRAASGPSAKGKPEFVHTLNGSGLAVGRTWLAILENYQQADGTVVIPEALRPWMGGMDRITHRAS